MGLQNELIEGELGWGLHWFEARSQNRPQKSQNTRETKLKKQTVCGAPAKSVQGVLHSCTKSRKKSQHTGYQLSVS